MEMKLTYVYHSCFALEDKNITIIFDYWQDKENIINRMLENEGKIYVFASHFHKDHFNSEILSWAKNRSDIRYIMSKDIWRHRRSMFRELVAERPQQFTFLAKGQTYNDGFMNVEAFGSTDVGVSWCVETCGKRIFHAGDLNNWHWSDECTEEESLQYERMYLGELKDIYKKVRGFDVAMFPVDSRIGSDYMRGARQFVDKFDLSLFAPMHFTANPIEDANSFCEYAENKGVKFFKIKKEGDFITF